MADQPKADDAKADDGKADDSAKNVAENKAAAVAVTDVKTKAPAKPQDQFEFSRDRWENQAQFLLSCIGYSVGLGNVWRFPYLCYKHGGAAFLFAYLFLQLTIGKPMYFMELVAGQYSGKSAVRVWDLSPASRGIGFAMCLVSLNISIYYNIIMSYVLYYFFGSFIPDMPWTMCKSEWTNCFTKRIGMVIPPTCQDPSQKDISQPENCTCTDNKKIDKFFANCTPSLKHATSFFFSKEVLNAAPNISQFGTPSWKLSLLLLLSWIIVILCLIKGIKSSGKVVYFTATFPYLVLLIMLIRGALLDGAKDGIELFIVPEWSALGQTQLWIDAAGQMFFSLSLSMGGIIMYGSYNNFKHPIYRDAVIISTTDLLTSVLAGFVIFSTLGYMAKQTGSDILKVAQSSFGLAFVAYPETLSTIALSNLWSCLFFFMLFTLGLDSQFALLETVLSYLLDDMAWCRKNSMAVRVGMGVAGFLLGLPIVCPGGQYLIIALDTYGSSLILIVISMLEAMTINWVYGINRFLNDINFMLGKKPRLLPYWYFVWVFWSPMFLLALFIISAVQHQTPKYDDKSFFGPGMQAMCWLLFTFTLLPVPVWFILYCRAVHRRRGPFADWKEFVRVGFQPSERWGPNDGTDRERQSRKQSVWADVLDWKIFQGPEPTPQNVPTTGPAEMTPTIQDSSQTTSASTTTSASAVEESSKSETERKEVEPSMIKIQPEHSSAVDILKSTRVLPSGL